MSAENSGVGVLIFMTYHSRILGNNFGSIPKPIADDCFNQAGYCLDAPNLIPAGSVFADSLCEEFPHEPMETTIERGMT